MKDEPLICLYCSDPAKKSNEHVFSDSLGADRTIPWVCEACNNGTSDLDRVLAWESLLTLPRIMSQPDAVLGYSSFVENLDFPGGYVEVAFEYPLKAKLKTQLAFVPKPNSAFNVHGTSDKSDDFPVFFKILRKLLAKGKIREIQILSPPTFTFSPRLSGARLVMNRPDEIIFRASGPSSNASQELEAICSILEKKIDEVESIFFQEMKTAKLGTINQPEVMTSLKIDFGRTLRGVAKIAMNFVAQTYGPKVARSPQLDSLRTYIRHGQGSDDSGGLWDIGKGPEDSLTATRYVMWLPKYCQSPYALNLQDAHSIMLLPMAGRTLAVIEFYRQFAFWVDLGKVELPGFFPVVHGFNYHDRSDKAHDPVEIARHVMRQTVAARNQGSLNESVAPNSDNPLEQF